MTNPKLIYQIQEKEILKITLFFCIFVIIFFLEK